MKGKDPNPAKELYKQLRQLSCDQLWAESVPQFNQLSGQDRIEQVAVIRAVGVVFSESGNQTQKDKARQWLQSLLQDPIEKVRRYAMVALPKIGAGQSEEVDLIGLLKKSTSDREKKFLAQTLEKIGGEATLEIQANPDIEGFKQTVQRVNARRAREQTSSTIRFDRVLTEVTGMRIHLRCRVGLELLVQDEIDSDKKMRSLFHVVRSSRGLVVIAPTGGFKLADLFTLRCFGSASIVLGIVKTAADAPDGGVEELAKIIGAPGAYRIFEALTNGPIRYRLDFAGKGHQRSIVRNLALAVYSHQPALLNDSREAPWTVTVFRSGPDNCIELSPRLSPDPRFSYRQGDVPAASHPPLAACMVRLAGKLSDAVIWDPFCGSGLELIETALQGNVVHVYGTDRSPEAIAITKKNFAAAIKKPIKATFTVGDFRDFAKSKVMLPGSVSLIITNPPMGRRVPVGNLTLLIDALFKAAAIVLRPGGRLIIANPLNTEPRDITLKQQYGQVIDMGGFNATLQMFVKSGKRIPVSGGAAEAESKPSREPKGRGGNSEKRPDFRRKPAGSRFRQG